MARAHSNSRRNKNIRRRFRKIDFQKPDAILLGQPVVHFIGSEGGGFEVLPLNLDDLYSSIRIFLIVGKLLGLVQIQGLFQKDYRKLKIRKSMLSTILGLGIIMSLAVHMGFGIIAIKQNRSERADQYAWSFAYFLYYGVGFFIFLHFYRYSSKLVDIICSWNSLQVYFTQIDFNLFRDVNLMMAIVMISAIGENLFVNLRHVPIGPEDEEYAAILNITGLELYYRRANTLWANLLPYHHVLNLFLFVSDKLVLYAWTYTDIATVVFARALYFKFQTLCFQGASSLLDGIDGRVDTPKWTMLIKDFETLRRMLIDINGFLSPLIFVNYGINVYFLCLQFHNSVNPITNRTPISSVYALWAVAQVLMRVFIVSVAAARINDWIHHFSEMLRQCPDESYVSEVQRTENYIHANTIGLSGLGCFTLTKPMMLKVTGVIFSFEVVLLQALQLALNRYNSCPRLSR